MTHGSFFAIVIVSLFLLGSCQQVFTFSLAAGLKRPTKIPSNLTASQAKQLADEALSSGDKEMANALVSSYATIIANTSDPTQKVALEQQAVNLVVAGSGISGAISSVISSLPSNLSDLQTSGDLPALQDQLTAAISQIDTSNVDTAAGYINLVATADPSAATGSQMVMVAAALAIKAVNDTGGDLSNLTPAVTSTPEFQAAITMFQNGNAMITANGGSNPLADQIEIGRAHV
jgi:hypothetical protein